MRRAWLASLAALVAAGCARAPYTGRLQLMMVSEERASGAQVGVLLPYSRAQETEADRIGLLLVARAGYDPRVALEFWQHMAAQYEDAPRPPELLSTHPSPETRIAELRARVAEVIGDYEAAPPAPVRALPAVPEAPATATHGGAPAHGDAWHGP